MWKSVVVGLLVPFHTRFSMYKSPLFAWDLYDLPIKNSSPFFYSEMDISCANAFIRVKFELFSLLSKLKVVLVKISLNKSRRSFTC